MTRLLFYKFQASNLGQRWPTQQTSTNIFPFFWNLDTTAVGVSSPAAPSTTNAINESGVYDVVLGSNEPVVLHLVVAAS